MQKYAAAAADYAHLLSMQGVLHGRDAVELIPTAEALAKAHVFLRDFGAAKAELTRAHEIAAARYGKDDRRTKRIAEVLESGSSTSWPRPPPRESVYYTRRVRVGLPVCAPP